MAASSITLGFTVPVDGYALFNDAEVTVYGLSGTVVGTVAAQPTQRYIGPIAGFAFDRAGATYTAARGASVAHLIGDAQPESPRFGPGWTDEPDGRCATNPARPAVRLCWTTIVVGAVMVPTPGGRFDLGSEPATGARPLSTDPQDVGHWSDAAVSPDGSQLAATWSGPCSIPAAYRIDLTGADHTPRALDTKTTSDGTRYAAPSEVVSWLQDGSLAWVANLDCPNPNTLTIQVTDATGASRPWFVATGQYAAW